MQPFQTPEVLLIITPGSAVASFDFLTVPEDKRLIIEFVSGEAWVPQGQFPVVGVRTIVNFDEAVHHALPSKLGSSEGLDVFVFSQLGRLYADPGTAATALLELPTPYVENPAANTPFLQIWISGRLVDLAADESSS
jgi:hypothetical protein